MNATALKAIASRAMMYVPPRLLSFRTERSCWRLEIIEDEAGFRALEPWWDSLLERSAACSPFLRWDWVMGWWEVMRDSCRLAVGVLRNPHGEPVAIAPLVLGRSHQGARRNLRHLGFLGGLGLISSPRVDFIVPAGEEHLFTHRLCEIFTLLRSRWDCVRLNGIPEESPNLPIMLNALRSCGYGGGVLNRHASRFVRLPGSWEELEMTHTGSWRSKMRRKWKAMEQVHNGNTLVAGRDGDTDTVMKNLFALHGRRFPEGVSNFLCPSSVRFHTKLARRWIPKGRLILPYVEIEGNPAGFIYGFKEGDAFFQYQMGWDPGYSDISMGQLTMAWCLRRAIELGVSEYDTLPGEFAYKESWCPEVRYLQDIEAYNTASPGAAVFWLMRTVKRLAAGRPEAFRNLVPKAGVRAPSPHITPPASNRHTSLPGRLKKVVVLTADANTLVYHRGDLIRDLVAQGCEVVTSAAENYSHVREFVAKLKGRHVPIRMARSTVSLTRDQETILDMWRLFRREKPDALFAYTIKSVCYGTVLAKLARVPRIYALLPGMGITFVKQETFKGRMVARISKLLHRIALKCADAIFVQNADDLSELRQHGLLPEKTPVRLTAGSGVNLDEFPFSSLDRNPVLAEGRVRFALVSRLLVSKGVRVFAEAARHLKSVYPHAEFHLVGPFDPNPNRISEEEMAQWVSEGIVIQHGMVRDVASLLKTMHVFVLPTWYREGVPHATLEALSTGRPVVTTDSVGARETVVLTERGEEQRRAGAHVMEGRNGFLVTPQDGHAVQTAMEWFIQNPERIPDMGRASRQLAEEVFDVRTVNQIIMEAMGLAHTPAPISPAAWAEPAVW